MRTLVPVLAVALSVVLSACGGGGSGGQQAAAYFESAVYAAGQLDSHTDVEFSRRPNAGGTQFTSDARRNAELGSDQLSLRMDVWVPPNATAATPMPLVVFVHGGGYNSGGKEDRRDDAIGYARAGFVTASVNYRLTPNNTDSPERRQTAIVQAAEDVMNAVRFLKTQASVYHVDTSRVAIVGTSAGGGLALIDAVEPDTLAGTTTDHPGTSARVQAVVSTGATLVDPLFDSMALLGFDRGDAPVLMFHARPTDGTTGATWTGNVQPTCDAINAAGDSCTAIATPDGGHTVPMGLDGKWWPTIQPFLWQRLTLAGVRAGL
jgi:acetyl esterase/lipase